MKGVKTEFLMPIGEATIYLNRMLKNPDTATMHSSKFRKNPVNIALTMAYDALPYGKSKRVLSYIIAHDKLVYNFSGTDAVGPAIREGIECLEQLER